MVKFTSFESFCAYNVFCLTFRRNPQILIERKTLEVISRKNRGSAKPQRINGSKTEGCATMLQAQKLCTVGTVGHTAVRGARWTVRRDVLRARAIFTDLI